jgi:hypothetical protein
MPAYIDYKGISCFRCANAHPPQVEGASLFGPRARARRVDALPINSAVASFRRACRYIVDQSQLLPASDVPDNALFNQEGSVGVFNVTRIAANLPMFVTEPHFLGVGAPLNNSVDVAYTQPPVRASKARRERVRDVARPDELLVL